MWSSDSHPAHRGIHALCSSKTLPRCTAVRVECGGLLTEESEFKACWASYFLRLFQADPPALELDIWGVTIPIADPSFNRELLSFVKTLGALNQLKVGKAPGICAIHAELLKSVGNAELVPLQAVQYSVWNTSITPTDWMRCLVVPLWKGRGDRQDCNCFREVTLLSIPGKLG